MPITPTRFIWKDGRFIPFEKATIHVLSHVVHYGSSWFEGIRAYATKRGTAMFRVDEHMRRLHHSLKVYRSAMPWSAEELTVAAAELIKRNGLSTCYVRPFALRGKGDMGVYALRCPLEVYIAAWEWGAYLGDEAAENGVDVCISSWDRITPNALPSTSKAGGNYMNSQLVKMEAVENGYAEGICLDAYGNIAEGSGENVFIVVNGQLITPPAATSLLPGITRDTVMTLATDLGMTVREANITRAMVYSADEMFLTGTAVEVTPVKSVDRIPVGNGRVGPATKAIQRRFSGMISTGDDPHGWLTFVDDVATSKARRRAATK
ncbi:MAG: branched-chain amino acid transaminase [Candidatus Kapabacteria bacterium]|nr:branched-chain amino acid transaminase [Candidatus Kapabacteria bacterium]